jgi:thymidine phosphorylase
MFRRIIEHQGGDPRVIDDYDRLPSAPDRHPVMAPRAGYVAGLHAEKVGRACGALGGGRAQLDDEVDPSVGIEILAPVGAQVSEGDAVFIVHHRHRRGLDHALSLLTGAVHIADERPAPRPLILERILHG